MPKKQHFFKKGLYLVAQNDDLTASSLLNTNQEIRGRCLEMSGKCILRFSELFGNIHKGVQTTKLQM